MFKILKNDILILQHRLDKVQGTVVKTVGVPWTKEVATKMKENYIHQLETQGRGGGDKPLSSATWKIYEQVGLPDGSGIRNHVSVVSKESLSRAVAAMVIEDGKPSMIAVVQNDGVTIRVTDRMRGFLAHQGIFLKKETQAIVIPGRESFSKAMAETMPYAKEQLKVRLANWWMVTR